MTEDYVSIDIVEIAGAQAGAAHRLRLPRLLRLRELIAEKVREFAGNADDRDAATDDPATPDEAVTRAWDAFERNGFFVIVDGKQILELDQPLRLREGAEVRFLRLVPLVGG